MAIQLPNPGLGDGQTGDNEFVMWTKVKDNFSNGTHAASRMVGINAGNVLEYGTLGLGEPRYIQDLHTTKHKNGFITGNGGDLPATRPEFLKISNPLGYGAGFIVNRGTKAFSLHIGFNQVAVVQVEQSTGSIEMVYQCYTTGNTTKDGNGFLKSASPVVDLYNDHIELNHDAKEQDIKFLKNGKGDYTLKTKTGLRSDNTWRIEIPNDDNRNPLFAVDIDAKDDGTINIKCYKRIFNMQTFLFEPDFKEPMNITEGRFISVRLNDNPEPEKVNESKQ